jgi:hypothetical protein
MGTDAVFAAPRALRLEMQSPIVVTDDMGGLSVSNAAARLHYVVESELEGAGAPRAAGGRRGPPLSAVERARYVQLPPLAPEILRLAREVSAGARDAEAAAERIGRHLSANYRYTLSLKHHSALSPLEEFLFVRRSGNCEYFAAAMAYGRYFMVRLSDAHAWVEVHLEGRGWVAFDPSPRAEAVVESAPGPLTLYLDAARMRWYRYVVSWSLRDQVQFAVSVHRQASDVRLALAWPRDWRVSPALWPAVGLTLGAALVWWVRRSGPRGRRSGPTATMPAFYERALRLLARRGLYPGPAETARQFARRVRERAPERATAFAELTDHYERARFGGGTLSDADRQDVTRALDALRAR